MKILKILYLIVLLLTAFFSHAQKTRYIKTDSFEGVAFSQNAYMSVREVKDSFMPSVKDITKLEKKVRDSIGVILSAYEKYVSSSQYGGRKTDFHCNIMENLKKYKRQYTGRRINGKKIIFTQFFFYVPDDWKEKIYFPYFPTSTMRCEEFRISYAVSTGTLFQFGTDLSPM